MASGQPVVRSRTQCPSSILPLPTIARPSFPSLHVDQKSPESVPRCVVVHASASLSSEPRSNGLVVVPAPLGAICCRQLCSRAVGNLCGGAGATWQERSRLPGWACQCQQGAAHGNVRAAATLSAAFARPRVAAFASPRPCAARRCHKTLIRLFLRVGAACDQGVELARVRPGASMRAYPGDMSGTFVARGACVPLFQRPWNVSAERAGKCEFFVFNRARGMAGMGGVA